MKRSKFKVGDKVEVIKYGHIYWDMSAIEREDWKAIDMSPYLVGQQGIICDVSDAQNIYQYAIKGIAGKHAWYDHEQLKLVDDE